VDDSSIGSSSRSIGQCNADLSALRPWMDAADERCPDLPQVQDRTLGPGQEAWRTPAVTPHALHTGTGSRPSARAGVLPAYSTNLFASSRATTGR